MALNTASSVFLIILVAVRRDGPDQIDVLILPEAYFRILVTLISKMLLEENYIYFEIPWYSRAGHVAGGVLYRKRDSPNMMCQVYSIRWGP